MQVTKFYFHSALPEYTAQAVALYVMAAQQGLDGAQYELGDMR